MKLVNALIAVAALSSGVSMAADKKADHGTPNCEVGGKKSHAKDKAACEKKHGKFLEDTAAAAPADAPAATEVAPAAAPAAHK
jgi:hypothetical protein